jgi:hypothetical protein
MIAVLSFRLIKGFYIDINIVLSVEIWLMTSPSSVISWKCIVVFLMKRFLPTYTRL